MKISAWREVDCLQVVESTDHGWCFFTMALDLIHGFESQEAACRAASQLHALSLFEALADDDKSAAQPEALYHPFRTPTQGWAFLDRAGELHTTFPTEAAAEIVASKMKGGSL